MPALSAPISPSIDLEALNSIFETQESLKIIEWAVAEFGESIVLSSSFGAQAPVMLHMVTRIKPDIKIIFVDTGYLFPETHQFMEALRRRLNLNVWIYRTRNDPIAW